MIKALWNNLFGNDDLIIEDATPYIRWYSVRISYFGEKQDHGFTICTSYDATQASILIDVKAVIERKDEIKFIIIQEALCIEYNEE